MMPIRIPRSLDSTPSEATISGQLVGRQSQKTCLDGGISASADRLSLVHVKVEVDLYVRASNLLDLRSMLLGWSWSTPGAYLSIPERIKPYLNIAEHIESPGFMF